MPFQILRTENSDPLGETENKVRAILSMAPQDSLVY